eukprot:7264068-Pyramimonas_sp.AAC.1
MESSFPVRSFDPSAVPAAAWEKLVSSLPVEDVWGSVAAWAASLGGATLGNQVDLLRNIFSVTACLMGAQGLLASGAAPSRESVDTVARLRVTARGLATVA